MNFVDFFYEQFKDKNIAFLSPYNCVHEYWTAIRITTRAKHCQKENMRACSVFLCLHVDLGLCFCHTWPLSRSYEQENRFCSRWHFSHMSHCLTHIRILFHITNSFQQKTSPRLPVVLHKHLCLPFVCSHLCGLSLFALLKKVITFSNHYHSAWS